MIDDPISEKDSKLPEVSSVSAIDPPTYWRKSIPFCVFVLAFFVRLGYWEDCTRDTTHGFNDFHWLAGSPISDANTWVEFGDVIKRGCVSTHDWAARRPLYGYFLASIYTWTDARLTAAQWANVVMSSLSVLFLYSITCRLFGVAAGLGAATWFCFEPHSIHLSIVPLTETIGCFFTIWHLWWLIRATDGKQVGYIGAGLAFASANLTRTLSVFALPMEVLLIWLISARRRQSILKGFMSAFLFGASVTLLLVAAMLRNYWMVGIFTISDNTSSILYSVTSLDYGSWSSEVELETRALGLTTIKDRYDYYMGKAKENLKQHPWVYAGRVEKLFWDIIAVSLDSPWFYWYQALFAGTLILSAIGIIRDESFSRVSSGRWLLFYLVIAFIIAGVLWGGDIRGRFIIWSMAALALGRSILRLDQGLFVANLWFWSVMGVAAFGVYSDRFVLMFDWLLAIGVFGGLSILASLLARGVLAQYPKQVIIPIDLGFSRIAHAVLIAISAILVVSGYFGISSECKEPAAVANLEETKGLLAVETTLSHLQDGTDLIKNSLTSVLSEPKPGDPTTNKTQGWSPNFIQGEQRQKGHLLVANARRIGGPYRIPSNASFDCFFDVAKSRPYDRTIIEMEGRNASQGACRGWVTLDADITDEFIRQDFLLVAVYDHYDTGGFSDIYEALAVIPLRSDGTPDLARGLFARSPVHLERVRDLISGSQKNVDSMNSK